MALSSSVGYSYKPETLPIGPGHTHQLQPLLEHLIELVESSGVDGLRDSGRWSLWPSSCAGYAVSLPIDDDIADERPHTTHAISQPQSPKKTGRPPGRSPQRRLAVPQVHTEEVMTVKAGSPVATAALAGEAPDTKPLGPQQSQAKLTVPISDPQIQAAAKQLIEKHTIDNVQLDNALQDKETTEIQCLLSQFEERKNKAIEDAMAELSKKLSEVGVSQLVIEIIVLIKPFASSGF